MLIWPHKNYKCILSMFFMAVIISPTKSSLQAKGFVFLHGLRVQSITVRAVVWWGWLWTVMTRSEVAGSHLEGSGSRERGMLLLQWPSLLPYGALWEGDMHTWWVFHPLLSQACPVVSVWADSQSVMLSRKINRDSIHPTQSFNLEIYLFIY